MKNLSSLPEDRLVKVVRGCLKTTIDAHGLIGRDRTQSAAKRITRQLMAAYPRIEAAIGGGEISGEKSPEKPKVKDRRWATGSGIRPVLAKYRKPRLVA